MQKHPQTHPLPKGEVLSSARRHMRHIGNSGEKVAYNAEQAVKEKQPSSYLQCLPWSVWPDLL